MRTDSDITILSTICPGTYLRFSGAGEVPRLFPIILHDRGRHSLCSVRDEGLLSRTGKGCSD